MKSFNIIFQESFQWREDDENSALPQSLNVINNISRINITAESIESMPEILKNFEIEGLNWIAFIPKVANDNSINYYSGKLYDVATCGCNDELWQYGSYVILPSISLDNEKIKSALNIQMNFGSSIIQGVLNDFKCIIISGNDGRSFDIIWRKDWLHSSNLIESYNKISK